MLLIKKMLFRVKNRLLRKELAEISLLKEELNNLSKDIYISNLSIRNQLIKSKNKKIKVVYFFQQVTIWNSFKSVYEKLNSNDNFDCHVVVAPFYHDKRNDKNKESIEFLENENVKYSVYDKDSFDVHSVDVVFFQTPYDCSRPEELAVSNLTKKGIKIAYIPYGLDVGGGADNLRWQYDLDCHNYASWIFVRSNKHKKLYGKYCSSGNSHVFVTGHPKFDQVDYSVENKIRKNGKKVFLWTPHFSLGDGGWSTFDKFSDVIITSAKENKFDLIIRPHPLFESRLDSCSDELKRMYQSMLNAVNNFDNITLDPCDGSYIDSFLQSDMLIADAGSFLLEYLPSRKPIIYLNNIDGPGLNESGSFSKFLYTASNKSELISHINTILNDDDYKKDQRVSIIKDEVHISEHGAAHEICEAILNTYKIKG